VGFSARVEQLFLISLSNGWPAGTLIDDRPRRYVPAATTARLVLALVDAVVNALGVVAATVSYITIEADIILPAASCRRCLLSVRLLDTSRSCELPC
jgi:hypothetical protein